MTVLVWSGAVLLAQDLEGTWQGTLGTPANPIRIVLKITRAADGIFEGQLFAIDQGAQPRTMSAISLDGRVVKWKVDALSATYQGTLTAEGNAMNGAVRPPHRRRSTSSGPRRRPRGRFPSRLPRPNPWTRQRIPPSRWRPSS